MNHESTIDLYCLGIVKDKGLASIRDLTSDHIPLLKDMQEKGLDAIKNIYGIQRDQIRVFSHYHPQFYHFHLHYTRLENEIGSTVEKGHLVSDIIQNLELDGNFYQKRTITYKLKKMSPLHNLIQNAQVLS
jgi:m7GpppX diphosphatase